jgi:hypothetical protein
VPLPGSWPWFRRARKRVLGAAEAVCLARMPVGLPRYLETKDPPLMREVLER